MSSDTISHLITAVTFIVAVFGVFGLPALAVVIIRFLKFKERELALDMEYRQKSQHQLLATSLSSHPELVEGPAAPDARHQLSPGPSRTKAR